MSKLPARKFPDKLIQGRAGDGFISAAIISYASQSVSASLNTEIPGFAEQNGYLFYIIDDIDSDIDDIRDYITASQETTQVDFYTPGDANTGSIQYLVSEVSGDGVTEIDNFTTGSFTNFIYDYSLYSLTGGSRAGQFMITTFNGSIDFTDTSTKHLNDSDIPIISAAITGENVRVSIENGNSYRFKALVTKL